MKKGPAQRQRQQQFSFVDSTTQSETKMETIKLDYSEIDKIQKELDLEDIADLEIDLHWLKEKARTATGPRAQRYRAKGVAQAEARIASLKKPVNIAQIPLQSIIGT